VGIYKVTDDGKINYKRSEEQEKINQIMDLLSMLELKESDKDGFPERKYDIDLKNQAYERLSVNIGEDNRLLVIIDTIKKEEDKNLKIIKYKQNSEYKVYEITKEVEILTLIDKIFDNMDTTQ